MRLNEKKSLLKLCIPVIAGSFILFAASCSKNNNNTGGGGGTVDSGSAQLAVVNASPTTSMYNVYSGSTSLTPSQIAFGSATGVAGGNPYVEVVPGTDSIRVTSTTGSPYVVNAPFTFTNNSAYTLFVYDTAGTSGQLKTLLLNDPAVKPTSGQAEVRFINLSSNSVPLYVDFINGTDTIRQSNLSYAGTGIVTADSLSDFTTVAPGTYSVQVSNNEGTVITNVSSQTFNANSVYTLYAKGYQNGLNGTDSLSVGSVQNY
ncbi:MAG TPA: DUF4397 domain-containing protein [Puia sp.]|jgi:hypothetical protein|nr:DUF4397 domain-containing protein [Puia sp.]